MDEGVDSTGVTDRRWLLHAVSGGVGELNTGSGKEECRLGERDRGAEG